LDIIDADYIGLGDLPGGIGGINLLIGQVHPVEYKRLFQGPHLLNLIGAACEQAEKEKRQQDESHPSFHRRFLGRARKGWRGIPLRRAFWWILRDQSIAEGAYFSLIP